MSKKVTSTSTMGKPSPIGNYRVDRISSYQTELEDYINGKLRVLGYKPVSISETHKEGSLQNYIQYTILSKKMNFFERLGILLTD